MMDSDAQGLTFSQGDQPKQERQRFTQLSDMYENWYLDYASYVILERAVPELVDGFKPVQRRILHSMKELDDGRYNKVANIIGHTMKYHPHGDASIGDALVQLGQKDLLIDCQGNWGNILTGDSSAAPRYIEARLSKFALDVVFNPKITKWRPSYDGRNKEPIHFPVKFPLLLAHGVEGIAVGLASKILPHNFNELIDASIRILKNQDFEIFPDFLVGGMIDVSNYNDGLRGGKIRVRAKISKIDFKTLVITEIPFSTNTNSLIESILKANDKGKLKIKKIDDNTSANVEILVHLAPGSNPDQTIDALYAFTDCEVSISPNSCLIFNEHPQFLGVKEILRLSTKNTLELCRLELEVQHKELLEKHLFSSLEKIFIENRIYYKIEDLETWEEVINVIDIGLEPYKKQFYREITVEDINRLTEIKLKRTTKYDGFKADEVIKSMEDDIAEVVHHLNNLIDYAIAFFQRIKQKHGKGRERKTEIRLFDQIEASAVAAANVKLYVNRQDGFAGYSLKKDEFVCDCSDIDDIIVFREDGTYVVTKVTEKVFVGKNVIHIDIFKRNDENTTYNLIYRDGNTGPFMVKRFVVQGIIRDKEYDLTSGAKNSKVEYLSINPNGETEVLSIYLKPRPRLKKLNFDFDFAEIAVKGRQSKGNILTKNWIKKITIKTAALIIQKPQPVWFDSATKRLNQEERGELLGEFTDKDSIIAFMANGTYCIYQYNLKIHFADNLIMLRKYDQNDIYSAVYYHEVTKTFYLKRFLAEGRANSMVDFVDSAGGNKLVRLIEHKDAELDIQFKKDKESKQRENLNVVLSEFIGVKGFKAKGKKLTAYPIKDIQINKIETYDISEINVDLSESEAENQEIIEDNQLIDNEVSSHSEVATKNDYDDDRNIINFEQMKLDF